MVTQDSAGSSNNIINVLVMLDTEEIIKTYKTPSQEKDNPTTMPTATPLAYMVATRGSVISGAGGGNLVIKANVGDVIRWTGQSESANFDSSILIYDLQRVGGDEVFTAPTFKKYTKSSMMPAQTTIFPVTFVDQTYWFMQADISNKGKEDYRVKFALYNRPDGGAQKLYGFFTWDPSIKVDF
jgi:hypothetical protein